VAPKPTGGALIGVTIAAMRKLLLSIVLLILVCLVMVAGLAFWKPPIQRRLSWQVDVALTYLRGLANPIGAIPTALPHPQVFVTHQPTVTPTPQTTSEPSPTPTIGPTITPTPSPTPIPQAVSLTAPKWEKQDANNCGPASLALYLRYYGWGGDQFTISELIKPYREDRNVNIEEMVWFVRNRAGWLNTEYRLGGDIDTLKKFIAAGIPVMIEEGMRLDSSYWPNDDRWAAHYMLLTGYDDAAEVFTGQDTYYGADKKLLYQKLDQDWQAFNRVYLLLYPPDKEPTVKSILGTQWDVDTNRKHALEVAQTETQAEPQNAFAWFNLGTNQAFFEDYAEATEAYDQARNLGLPQRMFRYQFGPFMAYFHSRRLTDLGAIINYALQITRNSEEAYLWRGWMKYRQGDKLGAIEDFRRALAERPEYPDALYALEYLSSTP
jgi:hypothetical protein